MKNDKKFMNKRVLVLGLAKSGYATAKLLHFLGAQVVVNDAAVEQPGGHSKELRELGMEVICGGHPEELIEKGFDIVVKNPGIPYSNPIVQRAVSLNIPVWTEIELAHQISEAPIIAITGSNGKTTTTTILYHILNIGKKRPLIAGNIGTVSCEVASKARRENTIVLEASSFQLMGTELFKPKIAIWTNLYEAHIDYHGSIEAYKAAKANITKNQEPSDYFIYNADQETLHEIAKQSKAIKIPFSRLGRNEKGISADEKWIYWEGEPFVSRSIIKLPGQHNLENILGATAAAILMGTEQSAIEDVLSSFTGVRHRMQFVKEVSGRQFYNDSKATNTLATKSALAAFDAPIVLIAGGLDRGHSFEKLRPYMHQVKAVVCLGETAKKFADFASSCGIQTIERVETMEDAVHKAFPLSEAGDIVLLSPSCASWDMYANFEDRGDAFIDAVMQLDIS